MPNETDVLHARTKTTGISETKFRSGQLSIQYVVRHVLVHCKPYESADWSEHVLQCSVTACSMSEDNGASGKNGFTALKQLRPSSFAWR